MLLSLLLFVADWFVILIEFGLGLGWFGLGCSVRVFVLLLRCVLCLIVDVGISRLLLVCLVVYYLF